jgi:threonine/homoserine efflux transporter RhtA
MMIGSKKQSRALFVAYDATLLRIRRPSVLRRIRRPSRYFLNLGFIIGEVNLCFKPLSIRTVPTEFKFKGTVSRDGGRE